MYNSAHRLCNSILGVVRPTDHKSSGLSPAGGSAPTQLTCSLPPLPSRKRERIRKAKGQGDTPKTKPQNDAKAITHNR